MENTQIGSTLLLRIKRTQNLIQQNTVETEKIL